MLVTILITGLLALVADSVLTGHAEDQVAAGSTDSFTVGLAGAWSTEVDLLFFVVIWLAFIGIAMLLKRFLG